MTKYVIENLGAPGKYMSCHGLDTVNEEGRRLCIWDNPSDEETQFYIFSTGNGVYTIANVKSKKCVNTSRHDRSNGGAVFQWDNPGSVETQFKITHHKGATDKGDYYNIESVYVPNTCINVTGNQTENGSKLILYNNPHAWSTQWYIRSVSGGAFDPNETVSPDLETFLDSKGYGPYVPNETFQDSEGYVPVVPAPVKPVTPPVTPAVPGVPLYYVDAPESARTYSSICQNDKPGVGHGRSCLDSPQAWSALHKKAGEWMQIDMGKVLTVAGTVLQGRKDMAQYLKTYTVATSVDGKNFTNATGVYAGQRGTVKNLFTDGTTIKARYVRIYVKTFESHPSTRAAVLVTESGKSAGVSIPGIRAQKSHPAGIDTGKAAVPRKDRRSAGIQTGKPAVADVHRRPAGINTPGKPATGGKPPEKITRAGAPESARVYSSIYANDKPGVGHGRSCLDSPQAWSALNNVVGEWMQLDLGEEKTVAGIAIQPRKNLVTGVQQYVKTYTVSTSHDGTSFTNVTGVYNGQKAQTIVDNVFPEGVRPRARYVRIYPQSWNSYMSLRCDVLISDLKPPNAAGQQGISVYGLGKPLTIENKNATGKFLSITNIGAEDTGASLVLWDNPTDLATQWYIIDIGNGQYNIVNAKSLKCVNVSRHRMNLGANVLQWDNPKSPETRFSIKTLGGGGIALGEAVTIESCYNSGKYINAIFGHKDNGTQLLLLNNPGNWATQWIIRVANDSGTSSRL